ncbi:MAG: adenylate kinase family protein [Pyrinomonadaceae bacterium]
MSKIVVLIGAPGAGKGTQARLLEERRGLPQISTGDIFRALAKSNSPLAEEVRIKQTAGELVSDDLVIRIVADRTSASDCRNGYVLDGFPRTAPQAEMLEGLARDQQHEINAVFVDVPPDILEKRLTGRRTCPVSGEIYNIYFKPPKKEGYSDLYPDVQLIQRPDDMPDKIKVRLEAYERDTRPIIDYFKQTGRLERVDGTLEPEMLYREIEKTLGLDKYAWMERPATGLAGKNKI